jgi:hypothetical protein
VSEVAGTMWPARNRSAPAVRPRPEFPTDQQVLDACRVLTLPPSC